MCNLNSLISRSSRSEMFCKKGVLRNFLKFTGKHMCQNLFFNRVTGPRPVTLVKKRLWHRCFPVNFAKFLRTRFLLNTSGRLLFSFSQQHFFYWRCWSIKKHVTLTALSTTKKTFFTEHIIPSYFRPMNIAKFLRTAIL